MECGTIDSITVIKVSEYYIPASPEHIKKEKQKARELKASQWWRQQVGPGICYHCKNKFSKEEMTMDHLIPIGRGGRSTKQNCVPSCKPCNTKKGAKTEFELNFEDKIKENSPVKKA